MFAKQLLVNFLRVVDWVRFCRPITTLSPSLTRKSVGSIANFLPLSSLRRLSSLSRISRDHRNREFARDRRMQDFRSRRRDLAARRTCNQRRVLLEGAWRPRDVAPLFAR